MHDGAVMQQITRLEELKRRVDRDPASISFAALAEEYRRLGRCADAIATCRAGLQRHPSYLSARVTLGRALAEMAEFDEATAELEFVLRAAPENLAAIRALAEIHRRRAEMPETIDAYEHYDAPAAVPSPEQPVAVQSSPVLTDPEGPALAGLESFLAAIERTRALLTDRSGRDANVHAAR
jgi:tetratricopeptide (TPR) repeat protein